jgi:Tfp pilus assembly protein PilX
MKRLMKNESGVALVFTLMVLVVLSVLGATIGTVAMANVNLTENERDYQAAYYIAEAGVNETYLKLETSVENIYHLSSTKEEFDLELDNLEADLSYLEYNNFDLNDGTTPNVSVHVEKEGDKFIIKGTGEIGSTSRNVIQEVNVKWANKGTGEYPTPALPAGFAAFIKSSFKLVNGAGVSEKILAESSNTTEINIPKNANNNNGKVPDVYFADEYPQYAISWSLLDDFFNGFPSAPALPFHPEVIVDENNIKHAVVDKNGNLKSGVNGALTDYTFILSDDYQFNSFRVEGTLNIDTKNQDRIIVVNKLSTAGSPKINIIGDGKVTIFVLNDLEINYGEINQTGKTNQLTIYYMNNKEINLKVNEVNAGIISKSANVRLQSNGNKDTNGIGYVITGGNSVTADNGFKGDNIIVAPYATVDFQGGVRFNGVVLADKMIAGNGMRLEYKELDTSGLPLDFITIEDGENIPEGGGDISQVIKPSPPIEE